VSGRRWYPAVGGSAICRHRPTTLIRTCEVALLRSDTETDAIGTGRVPEPSTAADAAADQPWRPSRDRPAVALTVAAVSERSPMIISEVTLKGFRCFGPALKGASSRSSRGVAVFVNESAEYVDPLDRGLAVGWVLTRVNRPVPMGGCRSRLR
jgi:hypothetical protein